MCLTPAEMLAMSCVVSEKVMNPTAETAMQDAGITQLPTASAEPYTVPSSPALTAIEPQQIARPFSNKAQEDELGREQKVAVRETQAKQFNKNKSSSIKNIS